MFKRKRKMRPRPHVHVREPLIVCNWKKGDTYPAVVMQPPILEHLKVGDEVVLVLRNASSSNEIEIRATLVIYESSIGSKVITWRPSHGDFDVPGDYSIGLEIEGEISSTNEFFRVHEEDIR
jgi:hypothetical protein